jgi:hypothetical protein
MAVASKGMDNSGFRIIILFFFWILTPYPERRVVKVHFYNPQSMD